MSVVTVVVVAIATAGCSGEPRGPHASEQRSPSDAFVIPDKERATVEVAANNGDVAAVKRLIDHYEALSGSDEDAAKWKAVARERGDSQQLNYYAASTLTAARRENDPAKRRAMVLDALAAARRSNAGNANPSAQKLILEGTRAMEAEQ
ncbi:hypothetical protein [Stenotrophomonas sp. HMWF003]|uniref:hypothetical protein n=1 Tax=Stenotrophomonas sp. HMWF003 TaxID=2056840 RepID=UPI000D4B3459|nr:hypothetical protein [Stenotrophomonas sp. HMWF003]PTT59364.1 hypothetical protein DBR34_15180 [Stenotrophomonas sp. HMWF003]